MYRDSAFGRRVLKDMEMQTSILVEENRALERELEEEERTLTNQRGTLPAAEFRVLADAFDARVQSIRAEREARSRQISAQLEQNRERFLSAAGPVLEAIMRDAGAAVVLERRSVFISANSIDITELAVTKIDAILGDGSDNAAD